MASFTESLPLPSQLSDLSFTVASAGAEHLSFPDNVLDHDGIAGRTGRKKPAWSKPSGSSAVEVGPVMGAVSWPALTKSAQAFPNPPSSPSESPQDQSLVSGPLISSSSKKTITSNQSPNSSKCHPASTRQKSGRRSGMVNGGTVPASDEGLTTEVVLAEPGNRSNPNGDNGFSSSAADHKRNNVGGRRGSGGGNGSHRNRFSHGRDNDFGHRSFNGRDSHIQLGQHPRGGGPRPFPRPVPASVAAPIIGPHHLHGQPFRPMAGFCDLNSPLYPLMPHQTLETYGAVAFLPHAMPAAMLFPSVDPSHRAALLKQIDYYFSTENLCKDIYLRQQMNDQGWVPISLIAGFNKVKQLTNNVHYIFDTVQHSTAVEVEVHPLHVI
ncbi:ArsR-like helix-turn-helix domain-containing protein [Dioscorea alata]|uniref:ArsR-like helix-turn-helix domain-containing protein n=1 Tax=Dioscorea alata TaxID=55571 RepID=A0ACB7TYI2_DIOAL|nr:ArsR-like helix-turn-helix domain-containing protein [Dioscorea alata]